MVWSMPEPAQLRVTLMILDVNSFSLATTEQPYLYARHLRTIMPHQSQQPKLLYILGYW